MAPAKATSPPSEKTPCAMYFAGHVVVGDADETHELREGMLEIMVVLIRRLIEPNAKAMGIWLE